MSAHPVDIHVGKRIRLRRTVIGISQEQIGKRVGVTFQQIQKYERGVNRVGAGRLFDFANILGVSVGYFFDGLIAAPEGAAHGFSEGGAGEFQRENTWLEMEDKETLVMIKYFRRSPAAVRKRILDLMKALANE